VIEAIDKVGDLAGHRPLFDLQRFEDRVRSATHPM
jgi:hypothetical protein